MMTLTKEVEKKWSLLETVQYNEKICIFGNQKTLGSNACLCEFG